MVPIKVTTSHTIASSPHTPRGLFHTLTPGQIKRQILLRLRDGQHIRIISRRQSPRRFGRRKVHVEAVQEHGREDQNLIRCQMPTGTQRAPAAKGPKCGRVHLAAGLEEPFGVESGGVGSPDVGIRVHGRGGDLHQGAFGEQVSVVDVDVFVHDQGARRSPHEAQDLVGSRDEKRTPLPKGGDVDAQFRFSVPCALDNLCQLGSDPGEQHSVLDNVPDGPENDRHGVDDEGAEDGEEIASAVVGVPVEPACHIVKLANELTRLPVCGRAIFGKLLESLNETSACP